MPLHPRQDFLNQYFADTWSGDIASYQYSGFAILNHIGANDRVLDVGCGNNPFKRKIKNLTGVDPANTKADVMIAIEDYETDEKFDIALCLGSINFGSYDTIRDQTESMVNALKQKSRIYWRCNPAHRDHGNDKVNDVPFFHWRLEHHLLLSKRFGYEVTEFMPDQNRYYVKWERE